MTAISNFTQAVKELTGFDEEKDLFSDEKKEEIELKPAQPTVNIPHFDESTGSKVTRTMVIRGNITGSNHLMMDGKTAGDIDITSTVTVNGTVVGNVNAESAMVNGALKGNVNVKSDIRITDSAVMVGDVNAKNMLIFGRVKGNLDIQDQTEMKSGALIVGDLTTSSLASEIGSVIHGSVKTKDSVKLDFNEDKLFNI